MFDTRCVYCKHFNKEDGCEKNLDEDFCNAFEQKETLLKIEDKPSCENCVWNSNGFCDFDEQDVKVCRRFKSLKEDL